MIASSSLRFHLLAFTHLSWHNDCSWWSNMCLGSSWLQNWHFVGSSETAFSTARLREQRDLLISQRQFGQVAVSSFRRASASRWEKHIAHIKCPLVHCKKMWHGMRSRALWTSILGLFAISYHVQSEPDLYVTRNLNTIAIFPSYTSKTCHMYYQFHCFCQSLTMIRLAENRLQQARQ